ncbi:MAG: hypothetical protein AAFY39_06295, partial [Pseudomonadota bacterium]
VLVIENDTPADVTVTGQTVTSDGVEVTLSTGGTVLLEGLTAPIDANLVRIETPGTTSAA